MRAALLVVLAACSSSGGAPAPVVQRFSNELDVLFVIDNSSQTTDMQTVFAANFPKFVDALDALPGGRPNLHVGIVDSTVDIGAPGFRPGCPSPDPGDNGLLQNAPRVSGCPTPNGRYIIDVTTATGRTINYDATAGLASVFSCIAQVGSIGCGFEAPLEAMKRALDGSRPENAGFLRDDASLLVTILTDEDDCSAADPALFTLADAPAGDFRCPLYAYDCDPPISATEPGTYQNCKPRLGSYLADPEAYAQFLTSARPEQRVGVAVIAGVASTDISVEQISGSLELGPACTATINGDGMGAATSLRLASFVDAFADAGRQYTVCQPDYSAVHVDIAALAAKLLAPCVRTDIDARDTDSSNPGIQPACTVSYGGTDLPLCQMTDDATPAAGNPPCAYFVADAACGGLALRATVSTAHEGEALAMTCVGGKPT